MKRIGDESYVFTFLRGRGLNSIEEMRNYINPPKSSLYSPSLLMNVDRGATLLKHHLDCGSIIYDVIDSDQDGVTSSAILYNYLKKVKPDVEILWDMHSGKQHGVELDKVPQEAKLIIIPDAGSDQYEEHKILAEQGYDILVIDHHLCDEESEYACVINNQMGNYPNKALSGAGVMYKFCKYFDMKYGYDYADEFLDLAAVGIIGDVVELNNIETRYIVKNGLSEIKNFGLNRFIMSQSFNIGGTKEITPTDVSFSITPLVNAIIRVGTMSEKETLFKAFISGPTDREPSTKRGAKPGDTEVIADKAARIARNAKNHQQSMVKDSLAMIESKIAKEELANNKILLVALDDEESRFVNPNLTGLIAMKLASEYNRPSILIRAANDDIYKGSFRVNSNSPIENFKKFCSDTNLTAYVKGHESAAGIGIPYNNIDRFISLTNKQLKKVDLGSGKYFVDFEFNNNDLDQIEQACYDLDVIANVYGKGVEEPKVIIKDLLFTPKEVVVMGKDNSSAKININNLAIVKFKDTKFVEDVQKYSLSSITIYGKLNLNNFAGKFTPQVIIEDYEIENASAKF